jgi:hypothetical protein
MRFSALLVALSGLALLAGTSAASAGEPPGACEVTSLSRVESTVHLQHSILLRNTSDLESTAGEEPSELPFDVHTICDIGVWTGSKPKTRAAVLQRAKSGDAAQVGVETWAPNEASPNVGNWFTTGYEETTSAFLNGRFALVYKIPGRAKPLNPQGEGYSGAGVLIRASGFAKGLIAAIGCWWDHSTYRDICLLDEEAVGKPVVDHLNVLAKNIVPKFLGAP